MIWRIGRLSGVNLTLLNRCRISAVDPKPTSDALRRSKHEANGAFPFGSDARLRHGDEIEQGYRLQPSRNVQIAMPWTSTAAMNIPVATPLADKATVDAPNSPTTAKSRWSKRVGALGDPDY